MAQEKPIIIDNFQKETAMSAYVGFEEMRCLDTKNKIGAVLPNYSLVKESSTTVDDWIIATAIDDDGNLYGISQQNGNNLFKRTQAGVWSKLIDFANTGLAGIAFWEGHIILIHTNGSLDASDDGGATWTNGFDTATNNDNLTVPTISAQDGKLYMGVGNDVDSLAVGSSGSFDPTGSAGTDWVLTESALDLPSQYEIRSIVALGDDLMLGTWNSEDENDATIFPWDRSSDSFDQPIRIKENGITYMIEVENLLYVMAGTKGRWYVTNKSSAKFLAEIPKTMFDLENINLDNQDNNAVAYNEGLIFFGVTYGTSAATTNKLGVYSLNPQTGKINFAHIISTGNIGTSNTIIIASITKALRLINGVAKETIVVTWHDDNGDTDGGDAITNVRYTDDTAFFVSQFLPVGTDAVERSFSRPEIRLARPLASGDSLKVYYRTAQGADWDTYGDPYYSEDTVGFQVGIMPSIDSVTNIQFKVVLNNNTELLSIRLI